jgi:hypothetical protein
LLDFQTVLYSINPKKQLTAGICAAKALVQHLCERLNDSDDVQVDILSGQMLYSRKFCIQEVLMHMCLPSLKAIETINIFFG